MQVRHTIAETFGDSLQPSTGWKTERLTGYLSQLEQGLNEYKESVLKAAHVDDNLKDHARAAKQHEILKQARDAFKKRAHAALDEVKTGQIKAKERLQEKVQPAKPDSSIDRLYSLLQAQEIRQVLRSMDPAERSAKVRESALQGDRSLLDAVAGSLDQIVSPEIVHAAEQSYQRAVANPELGQCELEGEVVEAAEQVLQNAERTLGSMERQEERLLPAPNFEPGTAGLTAKQKAEIVREHGQDVLMDVYEGRTTLADLEAEKAAEEAA
jgi:hypothetical protein